MKAKKKSLLSLSRVEFSDIIKPVRDASYFYIQTDKTAAFVFLLSGL